MPTPLTCRTVLSSMIQWWPRVVEIGADLLPGERSAGVLDREALDPDEAQAYRLGCEDRLLGGDLDRRPLGRDVAEETDVRSCWPRSTQYAPSCPASSDR